MEYNLNTVSVNILWTYISTPVGFSSWFADDVTAEGKSFTFYWAKEGYRAEQVGSRLMSCIKFHWCGDINPKSYFEFRIHHNALTNNIVLEVTDFAKKTEIDDGKKLWDEQISALRKRLGANA